MLKIVEIYFSGRHKCKILKHIKDLLVKMQEVSESQIY